MTMIHYIKTHPTKATSMAGTALEIIMSHKDGSMWDMFYSFQNFTYDQP